MNKARRTTRAFTLTELLVSIAAIALLTVGVGRIFRSVSTLISTGSAVSEIDQVARAIEKQLRDDFAAFNRMRAEETFLAIRMREVGDINHNGALDIGNGEVPIYLSIEDRNADRDDIAQGLISGPYEEGSRAVTRRVDEMMFIGASDAIDYYTSFQVDQTSGEEPIAQYARIYYGHGLRPIPDPDWPPADPNDPTSRRVPTRWFYPDGDFGSSPSPIVADPLLSENRFDPNGLTTLQKVTGRNEFARQWPLARQPLLLSDWGGAAAGYANGGLGEISSPIGNAREIAPYPRDIETEQRIDAFIQIDNELDLEDKELVNNNTGDPFTPRPDYRRIRDGRVDICPMTQLDLRRWLEGQDPQDARSGLPFTSGRLSEYTGGDTMDPASVNSPLWVRDPMNNNNINRAGVQRAIAGMFNRIQVETVPPRILRAPDPGRNEPAQAEDTLMDLHAVLATRCSNFEIAWSDGSTALENILNAAGHIIIKRGEMIWFDITPLSTPVTQVFDRSLYENWSQLGPAVVNLQRADQNVLNQSEITSTGTFLDMHFYNSAGYYDDGEIEAGNMVGANALGTPSAIDDALPAYSTFLTGGAPRTEDEAFVIFPFRQPKDTGDWGGAWDKTLLIRVRVTLHDTLGRLPEGKDFEFIFTLDPQGF